MDFPIRIIWAITFPSLGQLGVIFILFKFQMNILQVNMEESDQTPHFVASGQGMSVVMDGTMGSFFKPEKNLEFFRLKNDPIDAYPGKHE